jgi:hypothetical protein
MRSQQLGEKLRLEAKQATGAEIFLNARTYHMQPEREVVLSMGAIQTPKVRTVFPEMRLWQGGDPWLGEKIGTGTLFCLRLPLGGSPQ